MNTILLSVWKKYIGKLHKKITIKMKLIKYGSCRRTTLDFCLLIFIFHGSYYLN